MFDKITNNLKVMKNYMKHLRTLFSVLLLILLFISLNNCSKKDNNVENSESEDSNFLLGWASADITPDKPVLIHGQLYARVSEGIMDPITATALAIESGMGSSSNKTIMISVDLCVIFDGKEDGAASNLRDNVRNILKESLPEIPSEHIFLNATHTHAAPLINNDINSLEAYGIDLDIMSPSECLEFVSSLITETAKKAWNERRPAGISYGLGHAVVSHNRLAVDKNGKSTMMLNHGDENFSHVEGYEDHSVNLIYTWNNKRELTGVLINVAGTSQATGSMFMVSADYWHDTRVELRKRLGNDIFIFPQSSPAGDQCPHIFFRYDFKAEERMQKLMFPGVDSGRSSPARRKQIAMRISDAVTTVLPYVKDSIEWDPVCIHKMELVKLSRRLISMEDVNMAIEESENHKQKYFQLLNEIKENPGLKKEPRWYRNISSSYVLMNRGMSVKERYELEKVQPKIPVEVHVVRLGDVVIATNPFELYLDYGIRIKAQSPAVQTFLVQLAGGGSYVPTSRSIAGGAYGAVPASTLIGPEGGQELVDKTVEIIKSIW